ncbi:MAG: HEXXH motif domain-containing protein [Streptosporangiaceae bacterium]
MLTRHRLPAADLDALASGLGSAATIAGLRPAQLSMRLIALRAVLDAAERAGHENHLPGFDLLSKVQERHPGPVAEVLGYPFIGSWAARCLRLLGGGDGVPGSIQADLGHLRGIAAAAAIRAGVSFSIEVPVRDGATYLPTLGRLMRAEGLPAVTIRGDGRDIRAGRVSLTDSPDWQPLRRISSVTDGQVLAVVLDDVDPFRGGPRLPVAPRLGAGAVRTWEHSVGQAWGILVRHHPDYAGAIGAGLVTLVPMVAAQPNRGVNATSRESFGAASISPVRDPVTLAVGILHEFQHCKLNAVLDLVKLHRPDEERHYAPWRQDPRPLGGLLHGTYAYIGVSDFWRVQATLATTSFPAYAQMEFARWSDRTARVLDGLLGSQSLTPVGQRFILGMRERLRSWPETVPEEPGRLARTAAADHRLGWRLRNAHPDATAVDALASAWRAGAAAPAGVTATHLVDGGIALGASSRLDLLYLRLREPGRLAAMTHSTGIERADAELISGNVTQAAAGYLERIRQEPRCPDGWAGLAMALGESTPALLHAPELVCAVYNRLLETAAGTPDPGVLAEWMAPAVPADPFQLSDPVSPSPSR